MTYQEVYMSMTKRERAAVHVACLMRTNEEGYWTTCLINKIIYRIANVVLGKNLFDWEIELAESLSDISETECRSVVDEMKLLKAAM